MCIPITGACAQRTAPFCYGRFVGSNSSQAMLSEKQRHFVTAGLLEAAAHKQCCPRNSAILLRSFLSSDVIEIVSFDHKTTKF